MCRSFVFVYECRLSLRERAPVLVLFFCLSDSAPSIAGNNSMPEVETYLSGYPVVIEQAVAWGEMDAYQHVNNIVYFRYFENARIEYMRRAGWDECMEQFRIGPIVSAVSARFKRPVTYPDTISIGAKLKSMSEDRFVLEHIIVSHEQKAIATTGEGTIVMYNYDKMQKAPIPELMRNRIIEMERVAGNPPDSRE